MNKPSRSWNGGTRKAALRYARRMTDDAVASGCERCPTCHGDGTRGELDICPQCNAAGFLVPSGGMPKPQEQSQ